MSPQVKEKVSDTYMNTYIYMYMFVLYLYALYMYIHVSVVHVYIYCIYQKHDHRSQRHTWNVIFYSKFWPLLYNRGTTPHLVTFRNESDV